VDGFNRTLDSAITLAENDYIVTLGIKPDCPETGYGYIKRSTALHQGFKVEKFVEKPDLVTAEKYLADGSYYWNGGIFIGKISVFMSEFQKYAPAIVENLKEMKFDNCQIDYRSYEKMPSISIDYAVMEKSDRIALVPLQSDWNDLGSWQAIYDVKSKDENGNVLIGKTVTHNVKNSLLYSQKEIVAVSDLEDIILIETEDAIMACKMDESQNVKKLYETLKREKSATTQLHKTVARPWGYYTLTDCTGEYLNRTLCILPQKKLSLHCHFKRSEHWVVLSGEATIVTEEKTLVLKCGESFDVPVGVKHSLQNLSNKELKIIEVQIGENISEEDIERF
jgi:mannose-1-phosphate guanylyltransferase/mannose-6-phosphate isomerase